MRLLVFVTCLVIATAAAARTATAQATRPAPTDAGASDIQRRVLLASLSAYSSRTRQDAQEKLRSLGDAAEPGLVHAAATAIDPDARERARLVLDEILTQRRLRELMEPTRVSLHFDETPARQVVASLYVRAGAQLRVFPPGPWESAGDEPVTVHLDDVPFWDAVHKVEELIGRTLVDAGWGAGFVDIRPEVARGRVSVRGPFRVVAEDGPMPGSIRSLKVFLEPKIQVAWHARQATLLERGEKDDARPLWQAWQADRWADSRVIGKSADVLEVELPLVGVMRPVAHAKGTIPALLVAREEVVEDLLPASWGTATVADRTFVWRLDSSAKDVHYLTVEPQIKPLFAPNVVGPQHALPLASELPVVRPTLYDARVTPLWRSRGVALAAAGSYAWTFQQGLWMDARPKAPATAAAAAQDAPEDVCGPPARLTLALPTMTREILIPFEFGRPPK